jgi:hypothetical protein
VADELARWAASRAPAVIARAEAEAAAELKQALLQAALGGSRAERSPEPAPARRPAHTGDALWAYCVAGAGAALPDRLPGVAAEHEVEQIEHGELCALVSRVPLDEFAEEALRRNLNDFDWLERVARAHEAILERALAGATIVPLRLCTIFADEQGVRRMLDEQQRALARALEALDGREEWAVKLLVERAGLEAAARARSAEGQVADEEPTGSGAAYLQRRRLDREVRDVADRLAADVADDVHARLQDWAVDAVLNAPQNPELSGHEGDMLLNGAYLVESGKAPRLRELVAELENRHRGLGARLELSGPLPAYNFVPRAQTAPAWP